MSVPPPNPQNGEAAPKSQKAMTKTERRELQEKQRAAKAAAKASGPQSKGSSAPSKQAANPPSTPSTKKSSRPSEAGLGTSSKGGKDLTLQDDDADKSRGLRIFQHFGLPKPVSQSIKGDIHPAIIRLGLQFSEFKIMGANARCIATLEAFKTVR
jgi:translation initiation factor eIF-2B subunit delta